MALERVHDAVRARAGAAAAADPTLDPAPARQKTPA
jgi:hypothetical protein